MKHPGILNDVLFKIVFGSEGSAPLLRRLLNALLSLDGLEQIEELDILNPHLDKSFIDDKGPILDVKARDKKGRRYNIEVQLSTGAGDYLERSLFYSTRFFAEQLQSGCPYSSLKKTVTISLLDFVLFPTLPSLHSRFFLWEPEQEHCLTELLELHYIELPKFSVSKAHHLRTRFEKWLYFLKFSELLDQDIDR